MMNLNVKIKLATRLPDVGHVFIELDSERVFGFYPIHPVSIREEVAGRILNDKGHEYDLVVPLIISESEMATLEKTLNHRMLNVPNYSIIEYNCAAFVFYLLEDSGINHPFKLGGPFPEFKSNPSSRLANLFRITPGSMYLQATS
jgi:hypothetical protein